MADHLANKKAVEPIVADVIFFEVTTTVLV
jgi:hypothetical protein